MSPPVTFDPLEPTSCSGSCFGDVSVYTAGRGGIATELSSGSHCLGGDGSVTLLVILLRWAGQQHNKRAIVCIVTDLLSWRGMLS